MSDCINWDKAKDRNGYGKAFANGVFKQAHRLAWENTYGQIPEGLCVLHKCDNPSCVNPEHLWLGTHTDNMQDKVRKGRGNAPRGEKHGMSKLTKEDIKNIRLCNTYTNTLIALAYGVSARHIRRIKTNKSWKYE